MSEKWRTIKRDVDLTEEDLRAPVLGFGEFLRRAGKLAAKEALLALLIGYATIAIAQRLRSQQELAEEYEQLARWLDRD